MNVCVTYYTEVIPLVMKQKVLCSDGWKRDVNAVNVMSWTKNGKSVDLMCYDDDRKIAIIRKKIRMTGLGIAKEGIITVKINDHSYEIGTWNIQEESK